MSVVVTGAAGFIGSHLAEALVRAGRTVRGVDCFTTYYGRSAKDANLRSVTTANPGVSTTGIAGTFEFVDADLRTDPLDDLVDGVDTVFHLAAQPGVRASWGRGFPDYAGCNVAATQRLLEACRRGRVRRVVYASSSSVYGDADRYPVVESDLPAPASPYAVTKLAGEHLCRAYGGDGGLSVVCLRYFTVFGPRQRPDMAIHRLIESARTGTAFPRFGTGQQVRDFTFVADVVSATVAAGSCEVTDVVLNVCGGIRASVQDVIDLVGDVVGRPVVVDPRPAQRGDAARTSGANDAAAQVLGWTPVTDLRTGIVAQSRWHQRRADAAADEEDRSA